MKKILALLLAVLMIVGMAACSEGGNETTAGTSGSGSNTPAPSTDASGNVVAQKFELKVWTPAEDQAEGNNWLVKMEEAFAAAHPEYDINWVNESLSEGDAGSTVAGDVTASADVFMFANDQLGTLITAGGLSRLGGKFEEQIKADNSEFMVTTVTHTDGGIYGFPVTNNTWFCYYNTDVFSAEDVKSLDTMLEKGKVCVPFTNSWNGGCFFLGCGGTVFGPNGTDAAAGIQFGKDNGGYIAAKKMLEVAANANCVAGAMDVGKLQDGEVAAAFSGSWDAAKVKEALGDKMGVAQLPTFEAEGKTYNMTALSGSKCVGVNPNAGAVEGKQKVATEFAAFLSSADAQLERYTMRGVIPAASALLENEAIKNDPVAVAEINTMSNCSVIQSALPEMGNYWTPVETFGKGCTNGDITMDNYMDMVDQMMQQLNASSL